MTQQTDWFSTWFDSPYYHVLYRNHDVQEAQRFMDNLLNHLQPKPHYRLLDLACGKGRYAIYLNQLGFDVTGLDLSAKSIAHARQFENERLRFFVHDMRQVFAPEAFDLVLNLFTSFGYFATDSENGVALNAMASSLKNGGKLVIDFMDTQRTIDHLVAEETKEEGGIQFHISRRLEQGFIVKRIRFQDQNKSFKFVERVKAISYHDFLEYFQLVRLHVCGVFGNYELGPFEVGKSERMIFVLKK